MPRARANGGCAQALPKDLADWQRTIEFTLGPFASGKDLSDVSTLDFSRSAERDIDAFCRIGFGAMLAKLAEGIDVQLATPVTRISWGVQNGVEIETPAARLSARAVIVTVSIAVLTAGKIKFNPDLPRRHLDAAGKLSLGSYDHIVLELPGNPLGLQRDELVFEKSDSARTGSVLANMSGTTLCTVDVGGKFGRDLAAQGEPAMVAFALDWLGGLYGSDLKKTVQRTAATRWNRRTMDDGGDVGGRARRAIVTPDIDGIAQRADLVCRRGGARDLVGHGRRRVGIGRSRRGRRAQAPERAEADCRTGTDARRRKQRNGQQAVVESYPRSAPPVRFDTSATIFLATASISSSVMVFSRGCSVTAMATDFLSGSMPLPS